MNLSDKVSFASFMAKLMGRGDKLKEEIHGSIFHNLEKNCSEVHLEISGDMYDDLKKILPEGIKF